MQNQKIKGLVAAPFTPMNNDGSINLAIIPKYYQYLKNNKVNGAFICGSTGEGLSLTMQEKQAVASAWADSVKEDKDFKLFLFVGGVCIADCVELAMHARRLHLDAISFTAPFYFKPGNVNILAECCKEIADVVPDMPFYYYHIPSLTGVNFHMINLLKQVDGVIPNFMGIKYTNEDFKDFLSCLQFHGGKYDMLWGRDANLLPALTIGAKGAVGSTYNYMAPVYFDILEALDNHEFEKAQQLQQKSIDMSTSLEQFGDSIPIRKAYMKLVGLDCGPVRLPLRNIKTDAFELMKKEAEQKGFKSFSSKACSANDE